ncbi:MAG: LysR family transcriptional regulator [Pseudomonadota bacterium]
MTSETIMDTRRLRAFLAVAEAGSLRSAAERLNISQPPLGRQIKLLEEDLSVALFERTNKGLRLTNAGDELLIHARDILQRGAEAADQVRSVGEGRLGRLTIQYTDDFAYGFLPRLTSAFQKMNPGLSLSLELSYGRQIVPEALAGGVDVGFVLAPLPADARTLQMRKIDSLPLSLAVPLDHRLADAEQVSLKDCAGETFIASAIHPESGFYMKILSLFQNADIRPSTIESVWPGDMIANYVSEGLGVAIVTHGAVSERRSDVTLKPLADDGATIERLAVWRPAAAERPSVRRFLAYLSAAD